MKKTEQANLDKVIEAAKRNVGYRALALNNTIYGSKTGTQTLPWDAPFIRVMFEESGLRLDSGSRASSLYEEFVTRDRVYSEPQRGDVVFFSWGSGLHGDGQTHVGLVTDVEHWRAHRRFSTVEAVDGSVQALLRFNTDAVAFGRPNYTAQPSKSEPDAPLLKLSEFLGRTEARQYVPIQQALKASRGLASFRFGHWDRQCESAYASWQRHIGMVKADGKLELAGLTALSYASAKFTIEA